MSRCAQIADPLCHIRLHIGLKILCDGGLETLGSVYRNRCGDPELMCYLGLPIEASLMSLTYFPF